MEDADRLEVRKLIGSRVRRRRKILRLTLVQLAEKVGCRMQQIQKYETGRNEIGAVRLYQLAEALDVQVRYFFEPLQGHFEGHEPRMDEAGVIKASLSVSRLPVHIQKRIQLLADDVAEALSRD